jgi:lipopolysaccharide transport system permease protein
LAILGAAVSMAFGALNVYYRDFRYALPFFLQMWLFASPVAYPLSVVPDRWRPIYVVVNPAAGTLDAFRRVLAAGQPPNMGLLAVSFASSAVVLLIGYRIFKGLEPRFADVV